MNEVQQSADAAKVRSSGSIFGLTEGMIVAASPVIAYAIAYAFECGYSSYFQIPYSVIDIGISNVFVALGYLYLGIIIIWQFVEILNIWWAKLPAPLQGPLRFYFLWAFALLVGVYFADFSFKEMWIVLLIIGVKVLWDFGVPLIPSRDIPGYLDRVVYLHMRALRSDTALDKIVKRTGAGWLVIVMTLAAALVTAFSFGVGTAKRQRSYLVSDTTPSEIVLREYGDKFILGYLDGEKKQLTDKTVIYRLEAGHKFVLHYQSIGPLLPREIKKPVSTKNHTQAEKKYTARAAPTPTSHVPSPN